MCILLLDAHFLLKHSDSHFIYPEQAKETDKRHLCPEKTRIFHFRADGINFSDEIIARKQAEKGTLQNTRISY